MLEHLSTALKWNANRRFRSWQPVGALVPLPEIEASLADQGRRPERPATPEIGSTAKGLHWWGANCHPFQRIAFRSTDIFAD